MKMAIIKCKMCGGDITLAEDKTYGTCEYCGSTMTFPKVSDEQKLNLFNRANHFRRQNEFDKAIAAYDKILDQDDTDAEAHWGAVLSRYGIEYVEDPVTHERIPTCHRVQLGSILTDADYLAALEHAPDTRSRDIYESEAKRIAEIQKGILAISAQEKPYDVFICYKDTDDNGSRTKDSTLAQDIYYQLTNEGYKVFFSRITLEEKLGQQYEPYIFAALNSAKVMLVIGTRAEHFNAVWVKNEWSRYLDLMKCDRNKLLIPCYRDMDPYDLPEELSALQSQDMSKIGFMQDIIRGVKKVLNVGKEPKPAVVAVPTAGPGVASLHKRAVLFLEDGDWDSASEYFDRILDIDPEYAPAYIGKVQVKNKVRKEDGLARCAEPLKENSDYQKALRFADEQQKAIYAGYNRAIEERLDRECKEAIYREADALEKRAAVEADFLAAAKKYDAAGEIRDAKERAANCRAKAVSARQAAERQAEEYKKQLEREREERKRKEEQARIEAERKAEQERIEAEKLARIERIEAEKRKKRNKIIAVVIAAAVLVSGVAFFINNKVIQPKRAYSAAQALMENGEYDAAVEAFTAMQGYGDSTMKVKEVWYRKGQSQLESELLSEAVESFSQAGDYSDSAEQTQKIDIYLNAREAEDHQNYASAHKDYTALGDFLDASDRATKIDQSLYDNAIAMYNTGDVGAAYDAFKQLGSYRDSADIVARVDSDYSSALDLWKSGDKAGAETALAALGSVSDASEKLEVLREEIADDAAQAGDYDKALNYYAKIKQTDSIQAKIDTTQKARAYAAATAALAAGDVSTAQTNFKEAGDYQDAAAQADRAAIYLEASTQMEEGHYEKARTGFITLGDYLDSAEALENCNRLIYDFAGAKMEAGDIQGAYETYALLDGYSDSAERAAGIKTNYQAATALFEAGSYDEAASAFEALGNYSDSPSQVSESRYRLAGALAESGKYTQAAELYRVLEGYKDSSDLAKITDYTYAKALRDEGKLSDAAEVLKSLGDYENAAEQLVDISIQIADKALAEKDYAVALTSYQRLEQTDKIRAKEYELAQFCYDEGYYAEATSAYELLGQYELSLSKLPIARYAWADQLFNEGSYAEAAAQFALLGDMTDSAERAKQSTYNLGEEQLSNGEYDAAKVAFQSISGYSDADVQAHECDYQKAAHLAETGDYQAAQALYESLGLYSDSATRATECVYARAGILFDKGDYSEAYRLYSSIEYQDSEDQAKRSAYLYAQGLYDAANYAGAEAIYATLSGYEDSDERVRACRLCQGDELMTAGKYTEALKLYEGLDYLDSDNKAHQCHYQLGHVAQSSGDVDGSVREYALASGLKDAQSALADIARDYVATNEMEKAIQVLWLLREDQSAVQTLNEIATLKEQSGEKGIALLSWSATGDDTSEALIESVNQEGYATLTTALSACALLPESLHFADDIIYTFACAALENDEFDVAVEAFNCAGDYKNAGTRAMEIQYQRGAALLSSGKYDEATAMFKRISGYNDAETQALESQYQKGVALLASGKYDEASAVFNGISDYDDAATQALESQYQKGTAQLTNSDYDDAIETFGSIKQYSDSETQIKECEYQKAYSYYNDGNYSAAYELFLKIRDYKDVDTIIDNDQNIVSLRLRQWQAQLKVGKTVYLGTYEQDGDNSNGKERIEWLVLAKNSKSCLLVSRYAIDYLQFNDKRENVTWKTCSLRKWLNGPFLEETFTGVEKKLLLSATLPTASSPKHKTSSKKNTDRVFILSREEIKTYFPKEESRNCTPTEYARIKGAETGRYWWADDAISEPTWSIGVAPSVTGYYFYRQTNSCAMVRPAIVVSLGKNSETK